MLAIVLPRYSTQYDRTSPGHMSPLTTATYDNCPPDSCPPGKLLPPGKCLPGQLSPFHTVEKVILSPVDTKTVLIYIACCCYIMGGGSCPRWQLSGGSCPFPRLDSWHRQILQCQPTQQSNLSWLSSHTQRASSCAPLWLSRKSNCSMENVQLFHEEYHGREMMN